jgi:hypothetical protein
MQEYSLKFSALCFSDSQPPGMWKKRLVFCVGDESGPKLMGHETYFTDTDARQVQTYIVPVTGLCINEKELVST